jgi:predicted membrane protein
MREIIEYPHLLIPIVISLLSLLFLFYKRKQIILKTNLSFFIALVLFFAFYLLIVSWVLYLDIHLQSDLSQYDLNNDGVFNGEEINEKQKIAMNKVSSDTSRNFSFNGKNKKPISR